MDQTYEEKPPLTVICRYDQAFLSNGGDLSFAVVPTPENTVQDWCEGDPSLHYFFAEISSDISVPLTTVEEYHATQELLKQQAATENEPEPEPAVEIEGEEVGAKA